MKQVILASESVSRKGLMKRSGIPFQVIPSNYEEDHTISDNPYELVQILALGKAGDVLKKVEGDAVIIGADSMVVYEGRVIGKPKNREEAYEQISMLSGSTHSLVTGVAVIDNKNNTVKQFYSETRVVFRKLSNGEINDYLDSIEYWRHAGSYAIDSKSMLFTERIDGSHTNVIGLPMNELSLILKDFGINVFKK